MTKTILSMKIQENWKEKDGYSWNQGSASISAADVKLELQQAHINLRNQFHETLDKLEEAQEVIFEQLASRPAPSADYDAAQLHKAEQIALRLMKDLSSVDIEVTATPAQL